MNHLELLGSMQRALIGHVTPNLRSVYLDVDDSLITLVFFYDKPPSEDEMELASLADTEFISDYPSPEYRTECKIFTLPYPENFPKHGLCVYKRYE